jgi:predicted nucleic acid-binding protein
MKIVVDTNIIFSALLNSNGTIGDVIFNCNQYFEFYSCSYMRFEIKNHWQKLKKISKLTEEELEVSYALILSKINFINEDIIPIHLWQNAEIVVKNIDVDDIDFVALTTFLNATLWTGDKTLYKGLKAINFEKVMKTDELLSIRNNLN